MKQKKILRIANFRIAATSKLYQAPIASRMLQLDLGGISLEKDFETA
ncbi:MAG: hypothetical protein VB108_04050 [Anaerolineaceae bacterium]|nr:hypothetical protein [Anaerolineaceae bacterium]